MGGLTDEQLFKLRDDLGLGKETGLLEIIAALMARDAEQQVENNTLRLALAELREEREWRDIESAPKDGTKVLIFVSSDDDSECYKIAYWSNLAARPGWFYRGGWLEETEADGWQFLPAPPSGCPRQ